MKRFLRFLFLLIPVLILAQQKNSDATRKQFERHRSMYMSNWLQSRYDLLFPREKSDFRKAQDLSQERKYGEAVNMFRNVVHKDQQRKRSDSGAFAMMAMGHVYNRMDRMTQSISCLQEALKIYTIKNNESGIAIIEGELSDAYYIAGQYDSALYFASRCVRERPKVDVSGSRLRDACRRKLAALVKLNRVHEIDEDIKRYVKTPVYLHRDFSDYLLMGNYYLAKGENKKSTSQYDSAITSAESPGWLAFVYQNMASAYYENGDLKKGYDCLQKSATIVDEDRIMDLGNLRYKAQENARGQAKLELILVIFGAALLTLSLIVFYQRKAKSKSIVIKKQNEELRILMKEIHHRVKNNLQVISSLLDLQSQTIENSQAYEAIKEGKNRVQSMALIHQNLYGERNLRGINIREYIDSLSHGLIASYNIKPSSITVKTDIDDLNLDVDTVVPLGLVLNELFSNALKHAFKNGQVGEIQIVLKEKDNSLFLKVKDNGPGFPSNFNVTPSSSFGMKLIKAFSIKLKATLETTNNNGACVALNILKYKKAQGSNF